MSRPLHVALLQLAAVDLAAHERGWQELLRRLDQAGETGADLLVLPEASYPAYFLGSREAYEAANVLPDAAVEQALSERARRFGSWIAAGLVQRSSVPGGALRNVAVLFDPDGNVAARHVKRFLWHFDRSWFGPGELSPVVSLAEGRAGLVICADLRQPEISRTLALEGAELLIDCTAWVSSGRDPAALNSPQVEYMAPARAIENGTWIVAADKVGVEAGSIVYAGRSGVIDPRGRWVVQAPPDVPGIVTYTLDLDEATGPPVTPRPELYEAAAAPGVDSAAAALAREPLVVGDAVQRVAAFALDARPSAVALMERLRTMVRRLAAQDVGLVVLPDLAGTDPRSVSQLELLPLLETLTDETGIALAVELAERENGRTYKTLFLIDRGVLSALHRQTHLSPAEIAAGFTPGDALPPVVPTAIGNIGLLAGAEFLAWCGGRIGAPLRTMARSRAAENRVYVLAAGSTDADGGGYVIDPSGAVQAETLAGQELAMSADVNRALARWNRLAPGTDPILDHRPASFPSLFGAPLR